MKLTFDSTRIDSRTAEAKFLNKRYENLLDEETKITMIKLGLPLALACLRFSDIDKFHNIPLN